MQRHLVLDLNTTTKMETWEENSKMVLNRLDRLEAKVDILEHKINEINIGFAVHEVKIGRSSAFFGAVSGMVVAILTAIIINYATSGEPKIIYKEEKKNDTESSLRILD